MNLVRHLDAPVLAGTEAARAFFAGQFLADRESLWIAHLDDSARCVHLARVDGEPNEAELPVRAIMADALRHGSSGIVLAHNHPSGDPAPSEADRRATRRLAAAAEAIDLVILDHLIFAGGQVSSFRKLGLL